MDTLSVSVDFIKDSAVDKRLAYFPTNSHSPIIENKFPSLKGNNVLVFPNGPVCGLGDFRKKSLKHNSEENGQTLEVRCFSLHRNLLTQQRELETWAESILSRH